MLERPPPAVDSPQLVWTEDGEPRSGRFGDVYFSRQDGLAESRAVFLAGCDLPRAWAGRSHFCVAELGFGTGLNIAALLTLWRAERPAGGHLNIFSVEGFPLSVEEARRALSNWPELAEAAEALTAGWPPATPGFHRIDLPGFHASLDLAVGDVAWALDQWSGPADAWFLDGFSPALNPAMWSDAVLDRIAARSAPDARLATFTVAGAVRRGLVERGFAVEKCPGHGRKRERLEARLEGLSIIRTKSPTVAVIGAGIAGAALARALTELGARPVVIEAERAGAGGSGFPSALVTPRLDAGDAIIAGFHAQALDRATHLYRGIPGAVVAEGVLQLEQAPRDAVRFDKIAAQPLWPAGAMIRRDPVAVSAALDAEIQMGGLAMGGAMCVRPEPILDAWLTGVDQVQGTAASFEACDDGWRVRDASGAVLVTAGAVVIAAGWGTADLAPTLVLAPVRGQADWVDAPAAPPAVAWGGYVAPTGTGFLYGATHTRGDTRTDVRPDDSAANLSALQARLPHLAARAAQALAHARAAVRATTRDRLPVCGPLPGQPGLYVLSGLGSRGFCVAPLLAEHLAAVITGSPSPLPADFAARLSPSRFGPAPPLAADAGPAETASLVV